MAPLPYKTFQCGEKAWARGLAAQSETPLHHAESEAIGTACDHCPLRPGVLDFTQDVIVRGHTWERRWSPSPLGRPRRSAPWPWPGLDTGQHLRSTADGPFSLSCRRFTMHMNSFPAIGIGSQPSPASLPFMLGFLRAESKLCSQPARPCECMNRT